MTKEEYNTKQQEIESAYLRAKKILMQQYASSNNPYKIGDVIEDHQGKIVIDKMQGQFGFLGELPRMVYYGRELKKDGTPIKKGTSRYVHQSNVKR